MPDEWFTLSTLGTSSGVVLAVTIVSQFLKGLVDRWFKVPTRLLVLLVSWGILLGYRYIMNDGLTFAHLYLDVLNGFLVALSAMGAHSVAKDHLRWK